MARTPKAQGLFDSPVEQQDHDVLGGVPVDSRPEVSGDDYTSDPLIQVVGESGTDAGVIDAQEITPPEDAWQAFPNPMPTRILNDYPFTGAPVWLTPDGKTAVEAVWRATRSFDSRIGRFGQIGFWAKRNAGGRQIEFTPLGWKRLVE